MARPKAAVFPLPVEDCPIRSRPASSSGMARAWTGVGAAKPSSATTWHKLGESPRAANPLSAAGSGTVGRMVMDR